MGACKSATRDGGYLAWAWPVNPPDIPNPVHSLLCNKGIFAVSYLDY